ncbi:MAG: cytochrome P450 [Candidatus Azotimanducaceae bacterium]|jgi:cytochrome P450
MSESTQTNTIDDLLGGLFSPAYIDNPYPLLQKIREFDPFFYIPAGDNWIVTSYSYTTQILRDKRFGHDYEANMKRNRGIDVFENSAFRMLSNTMLMKDPPDHKRIRELAVKAFGAAKINEMQPQIQEIVDQLITDLKKSDSGDLMSMFAFKLPVIVICSMLGVPKTDWARFMDNSNISGRLIDPTPLTDEELRLENDSADESNAYFEDLCAKRRQKPENDLITALVMAETEEGRLSRDELTSNIVLLFGAGHETTVNLIGNGLLALHRNPAQLTKLKSSPELMPNAVEELLRYDSSVQITGRTAMEDVDIDGHHVKAGQEVMTFLGAGNHDPEQFENPDKLDITREKIKPLSFGGGIHTCIGAQLSRIEATVALNSLLAQLPNLVLNAMDHPQWKPTITLRGLTTLPATW